MALENIINRIIDDAKKKADEIKGEARVEADRIADKARKKAKSLKGDILAETEDEAKKEEKRILSLARLEAKNMVLAQKRAVINDVFDEALKKLKSLTDEEYRDLIKKMLLKVGIEDSEELIVSSDDRKRINNEFLKEINKALKSQGRKGELRFSDEKREIEGGFILKKGKVEFNNSFSALVEVVREDLEPKIAENLLGFEE